MPDFPDCTIEERTEGISPLPNLLQQVDALLEAAAAGQSQPSQALLLARRARAEAEALECPDRIIRALLAEADAHYFGGSMDAVAAQRTAAAHARQLALEVNDRNAEIEALTRLMRAANLQDDLPAALAYSQQRIALARELYEEDEGSKAVSAALAKSLNGAAAILLDAGDYPGAEPLLTEALHLAQEAGDNKTEARILSNMGGIKGAFGQYAEAAAAFTTAAQYHARYPDSQGARIKALGNLTDNLLAEGRYSEAEIACSEALSAIEAFGIRLPEPAIRLRQGRLLRALGRAEEADIVLEIGYAQARASGDRKFLPLLRAEQGRVASARGDHVLARSLLEEALTMSREADRRRDTRDIQGFLAEAAEAAGDTSVALAYFKEYHYLSQQLQAEVVDRRIALRLASVEVEHARQQAHAARQEAEAMRRSNAVLQEFAAVASHDLKEPLRKILAFGNLLRTKLDSLGDIVPPEAGDYLGRITAATGRMQALIDGLLELARASQQRGAGEANRRDQVDLTAVAEDVVSDLEVRLVGSGGRVWIGPLPTILADPLQMRQLLQNLIGNSLKYHREGVPPLVRVEGKISREQVTLRVSDNGIGFAPEHAERIFGAFERVAGRRYEGTGVGLAICQRIVEAHGGTITAEGRLNEGAVFTVTLPIAAGVPETGGPDLTL